MNKKPVLLLIVLTMSVFFLSSCRLIFPPEDTIAGLWSGTLYTAYGSPMGPVVFEIVSGGNFRMGDTQDDVIYDEAISKQFIWSLDDDYLTVTDWSYMYFAEYAWELSDTGDNLTLVLIRRNFFNDTYEDIYAGSRILLTKDETNDFSYYFSSDYSSSYP